MTPTLIGGKYQFVRELGRGGMGTVCEAFHIGTGRRVAIKTITREALAVGEEAIARFAREVRLACAVETAHLVGVLDTGVNEAGHPFMVMEYLLGLDADQLIERIGPLPPDLALRIAAQACVGLGKAHGCHVVHRDIKPANMFLTRRDQGEVLVKVLDFGIAKIRSEHALGLDAKNLTQTGSMLGSPQYMSPEQAKGLKTLDHRSDLWSLGVSMYRMLTGATPYRHHDTLGSLIIAIAHETPRHIRESAPWVPHEIADIVHRALENDVDRRFQSADEMLAAIRAALPDATTLHTSMIRPLSPEARSFVPKRKRSRLLIPFAAAAGLFVGFAAYAVQTYAAAAHSPWQVTSFVGAPAAAPAKDARPGYSSAPESSTLLARPLPTMTTVQLAISPRTASVEIDGRAVAVSAGVVDVSGTMGSTHRVRVFVGKRQTVTDVAIVDTGIMPARVSLVIPRSRVASAAGDTGVEVVAAPDPTPPSPAGLAQRDPDGL